MTSDIQALDDAELDTISGGVNVGPNGGIQLSDGTEVLKVPSASETLGVISSIITICSIL